MFDWFFTIVYNFTYLRFWVEQVFHQVVDHFQSQVGDVESIADSFECFLCIFEDQLGVAFVDVW